MHINISLVKLGTKWKAVQSGWLLVEEFIYIE